MVCLGRPYHFKFLKAVFQKFYLAYSWILCLIYYTVIELRLFTKKAYLEWVKAERNSSKFTIRKHHINTMEIHKLFPMEIYIPVSNFPRLTILLYYKSYFGYMVNFGGCSKKPTKKIGDFALRQKRREKTRMVKVATLCYQGA